MVNKGRNLQHPEPAVVEDLKVFGDGSPVTGLRVYRGVVEGKKVARLIVMSRDAVRSVPLHRCHTQTTCALVYILFLDDLAVGPVLM
jgi:hypothetical protein